MIDKERLICEFIELVSLPSPSKGEGALARLVSSKLAALGLSPEEDQVHQLTGGDCGNLWAYWPATLPQAPTLFFEAHLDSVAPCTGTKVVRREGVLASDGTTTLGGDDKSGIAAVLEAIRSLQEEGAPHGAVQLCFTVSEEIGCLGAANLERSRLQADYGYCLDMGGSLGEIVYAAPKLYNVYVTVKGRAAHAGVEPEKGVNALLLAARCLAALPASGRLDEETTLSVNVLQGGVGHNIICPEASFVVDMRCLQSAKLDALLVRLQEEMQAVVTAGGGQIEFKVVEGCPAMELGREHPCIQLAAAAARALGAQPKLLTSGGCADSNYLCGYGLPCALLSTGMAAVHTTEEYLREEDLYNTACWVRQLILEAARLQK